MIVIINNTYVASKRKWHIIDRYLIPTRKNSIYYIDYFHIQELAIAYCSFILFYCTLEYCETGMEVIKEEFGVQCVTKTAFMSIFPICSSPE